MPKDATLNSLQSSLRASIELRLDPTMNATLLARRQLLEEEENQKLAKRREKEREKEKRAQRRKRREEKKKKEKEEAAEKAASTDSGNVADIDIPDEDDDIFTPKESFEDLDPHDRDVEYFKKFCLGKWI